MRIDDELPARGIEKKGKGSPARKTGTVVTTLFGRTLQQQQEDVLDDFQKELKELKREIDRVGDALDRDPTMANFKAFRELLTQLSRKVLSNAYKLELVSGPSSPRVHEIVATIDREADELYRLIMSEQKSNIKITDKILELKGLVISFFL